MTKKDKKHPIYMISIVSEMLNVHPQTLRLYEKEGLVSPLRIKRRRLYSEDDVERLSLILQMTRELGVNKAGVDIILRMRHRIEILQEEINDMMNHLEDEIRKDFREKLRRALKEE
jgi:MerR family transcriptional regulator/heat shock protein HspR